MLKKRENALIVPFSFEKIGYLGFEAVCHSSQRCLVKDILPIKFDSLIVSDHVPDTYKSTLVLVERLQHIGLY